MICHILLNNFNPFTERTPVSCSKHLLENIFGTFVKKELERKSKVSHNVLSMAGEWLAMVCKWSSNGWPMVGQWLANGWPSVGQWLANGWPMAGQWLANGWTMVGQWLANGCPINGCPMFGQWFANGWPMAGQWLAGWLAG